MCFVNIEKAFDRVQRKMMEWVVRRRGLPELFVTVVMSLYHSRGGGVQRRKLG